MKRSGVSPRARPSGLHRRRSARETHSIFFHVGVHFVPLPCAERLAWFWPTLKTRLTQPPWRPETRWPGVCGVFTPRVGIHCLLFGDTLLLFGDTFFVVLGYIVSRFGMHWTWGGDP